jgi:argininosuccinate lyase
MNHHFRCGRSRPGPLSVQEHKADPAPAPTGRIAAGPHHLLHTAILEPQLAYELEDLLPFDLQIEQALLREYARLEAMTPDAVAGVAASQQQVSPRELTADPRSNLPDISFASEQFVERHLCEALPTWHVDRSRNAAQACAQVSGRALLLETAAGLVTLARVISPGFYLAAAGEHLLDALHSLLSIYDAINLCPPGSGAMAVLGFRAPVRHALVVVASRNWWLRPGAERSTEALRRCVDSGEKGVAL